MSSKKDLASSRLVSKKEKIFNWIIFVLLLLGAVVMVFPLIYMIATSFMTKKSDFVRYINNSSGSDSDRKIF